MIRSQISRIIRFRSAKCAAVSLLLIACGCASTPQKETAPVTAEFTLSDTEGRSVSLSDHLGTDVVLISFWGSWCEPCRREMDALRDLHEKYANRGLTIMSISIDDSETVGDAMSFARMKAYPYKVLFDDGGSITGGLNPRRTTPFSIIIDRGRQKVWEHQGFVHGDEVALEEAVVSALDKKGTP